MNVCFIIPQNVATVNGGVRTQALFTIDELKKLGVNATLLNPWEPIQPKNIDIVHVFRAGPDTLGVTEAFSRLGKKIVVSPIFFSTRSPALIRTSLLVETLTKPFAKGIRSDFSLKSSMCKLADAVLPNTQAESELLIKGLNVNPNKITIVPNGVEERFAQPSNEEFLNVYGIKNFVLFAGQAGAPRKGVIHLLEAAKNIDAPFVIIGDLYEDDYGSACKRIIKEYKHIHHIPTLHHASSLLRSAYAACCVFVLPSLYETPGIAAMEAALGNSNVVITEVGGTKEYFGEYAEYIKPNNVASIEKAIKASLEKKPPTALKQHILENYTWEKVASKTLDVYKKLLS